MSTRIQRRAHLTALALLAALAAPAFAGGPAQAPRADGSVWVEGRVGVQDGRVIWVPGHWEVQVQVGSRTGTPSPKRRPPPKVYEAPAPPPPPAHHHHCGGDDDDDDDDCGWDDDDDD